MIEYLPRDFYNLNIKIIAVIIWLDFDEQIIELDFDRYIYKLGNTVFKENNNAFSDAYDKHKMWERLNGG